MLIGFLFTLAFEAHRIIAPVAEANVVWRGFRQSWDYNHRVHRLGDWVDSGAGVLGHAAATGTGPDVARYQSLYSEIEGLTDGTIEMLPGVTEVELRGARGEALVKEWKIEIASGQKPENAIVVLNGFDLQSAASADKIKSLGFSLSQPVRSENGKLIFTAKVTYEFDCGTLECERRKEIDYRLRLHYLAITGKKEGDFKFQEAEAKKEYSWDTKNPLPPESILERMVEFKAGAGEVARSFPAFTALSVDLNEEQHFVGWVTELGTPRALDNGRAEVPVRFTFQQWRQGMKGTRPWYSWFSFRDPGKVSFSGKVAWITLPVSAKVKHGKIEGEVAANGKDQKLDLKSTERKTPLQ